MRFNLISLFLASYLIFHVLAMKRRNQEAHGFAKKERSSISPLVQQVGSGFVFSNEISNCYIPNIISSKSHEEESGFVVVEEEEEASIMSDLLAELRRQVKEKDAKYENSELRHLKEMGRYCFMLKYIDIL